VGNENDSNIRDSMDLDRFSTQAAIVAERLQIEDLMSSSRAAAADSPSHSPEQDRQYRKSVDQAISQAESVVSRKDILARLCPALRSASDDIREVATVVSAALLPLALSGVIAIPVTPLAFAAVALVIVRASVATLCSDVAKHDQ
jgi:hypothetical protein